MECSGTWCLLLCCVLLPWAAAVILKGDPTNLSSAFVDEARKSVAFVRRLHSLCYARMQAIAIISMAETPEFPQLVCTISEVGVVRCINLICEV